MPSAFHANEGTTGIRRLYLQEADLRWCLSFENRRRIFDIDSRFKFDLIVAHRPGPTQALRCGFYLDRIEDATDPTKIMTYTMQFLDETGGTPVGTARTTPTCGSRKRCSRSPAGWAHGARSGISASATICI